MEPRSTPGTPAATRVALASTLLVTAAALGSFFLAAPAERIEPRFAGRFLCLFTALFLLRVAGQLHVRARKPGWLPPTEQWNLTPYGLLLPAQLVILALMGWIDWSFWHSSGVPITPRPGLGRFLTWLSGVYAGAMAVRYAVRMVRRPDQRWFGGAIPIFFHWVLASYLLVLGTFHRSY